MDMNAFASLAVLQLPSISSLLPSACCPDKDLVVLISRRNRLGLWKVQGSKKWEVDIASSERNTEDIVGLAWSPDGQSVVVAHDPPVVTIHSIQDGKEESVVAINIPVNSQKRASKITGIWWFKDEKPVQPPPAPDIFRKKSLITGSTHSILNSLPLLDYLDDTEKLTVTEMFSFQGLHTRSTPKAPMPEVIRSWPTLPPDLLTASISPSSQWPKRPGYSDPTIDDTLHDNLNSILVVADDSGRIHFFLDGSYPLGSVSLGSNTVMASVFKDSDLPVFYAHPQTSVKGVTMTDLQPATIHLPLLDVRHTRDMAQLSSTARELLWYSMRAVKEMRAAWFGCETNTGARELGPKWVRALEAKQSEQFGQEEPHPILDLTSLLVSGRACDSLHDFLGSGDQVSERGLQKWETTVTEALILLRDFAEKRVGPACQRLHLVLEELKGWSLLPQYAIFELPAEEIESCLELIGRGIVICSWLAAVARREHSRFKEFICWLRLETTIANPTNENHPSARHDILEVNNYLTSGLVVSSIDKWFMGPVPQFSSRDIGVLGDKQELCALLERAKKIANDPTQMKWESGMKANDLKHLDRNLDGLLQELGVRCHRVFVRASGAATRSGIVSYCPGSVTNQAESTRRTSSQTNEDLTVRERIIRDENEGGKYSQYLAMHSASMNGKLLCVVHTRYDHAASEAIRVAVLEFWVGEEGVNWEVVDVDFFDDESMVVVVRGEGSGPTLIASVSYNDLGYQERGYVIVPTREDLMLEVMQEWKEGHVVSERIPIKRSRGVESCRVGRVWMGLNGRIGRRVVCLVNDKGTTLECLDLEGDGDVPE